LAEVRANNDDSAGGPEGGPILVSPGTCDYGSYFWGDNNVCQRNLSYAHVAADAEILIELPFLIGNPWSKARLVEVIVHKGPKLADTHTTLRAEPLKEGDDGPRPHEKRTHGAKTEREHWSLTQPVSGVGLSINPGTVHRMLLAVKIPKSLDLEAPTTIRIFQRNDGRTIVGSVQLELVPVRQRDRDR
jgi:hypothetical protein